MPAVTKAVYVSSCAYIEIFLSTVALATACSPAIKINPRFEAGATATVPL